MTLQQLSPIQDHIIALLKHADSLRYRDLRPDRVPNDLFNYHLQFLVSKGFVSREKEGYALAPKGIERVADIIPDESNMHWAHLFKYNVIMIVSRKTERGVEILSQQRLTHPSYGKIGVIGGIVRKGEATEAAATRKLIAETGLAAKFRIVAMERRRLYNGGALFSDFIFPIAYAAEYTGELCERTRYGLNFWTDIDTAIKNDSGAYDSIQAIPRVLTAIRDNGIDTMPFFYLDTEQDMPLM